VALTIPDEEHLPPGRQRDLTLALYSLYEDAGTPGTRSLSSAIKKRRDLPDSVSHEAVRAILLGGRSRWSKVASLAAQLLSWSAKQVDHDSTLARIEILWMAATQNWTAK
jgi:hypothetical protein